MAIFEFAKDKFDFSENAISYLSASTLPDELVMTKLYEFILHAVASSTERIQRAKEEKKQKFKEDEKAQEAQDAQDADKLLNLIDLL